MNSRRQVLRQLGALALATGATAARAQATAARPIRLIVPYGPGGGPDILGRLLAQETAAALGAVVVENKPGAGGVLGADSVAKSAPDGYTLLVTTSATHSINPALMPNIPYDPVRDFTPVAMIATTPVMLVVSAASPIRTVGELLAQARAQPGTLSYATAGSGTMQHIAAELMDSMARVKTLHVPYKGTAQIVPDLVAGRVNYMFNSVAALAALVRDGRLRALAVTTPTRLAAWPDVPTLAESGLAGYEVSAWYGVFGPAGMAADVVQRYNREINRVVELPAVRERYNTLALEPLKGSPQDFAGMLRQDIQKWSSFIRERGIKADG